MARIPLFEVTAVNCLILVRYKTVFLFYVSLDLGMLSGRRDYASISKMTHFLAFSDYFSAENRREQRKTEKTLFRMKRINGLNSRSQNSAFSRLTPEQRQK